MSKTCGQEMRRLVPEQTHFSVSRADRDRFCAKKDRVLLPLLRKVRIDDPKSFRAILMPSLYGAEAFYLVGRGVPSSNLFAVENNCAEREGFDVHGEIKACRQADRQELKGMRTTDDPVPFALALDRAYDTFCGEPYHLIYMDFLSQPDVMTHYEDGILKIMQARMLAPRSALILNFGKSRCKKETAEINHEVMLAARRSRLRLDGGVPTELYVGAAISKSGHPPFKEIESVTYYSDAGEGRPPIEYTTTMARFEP
jgi:hypothetical protein